MKREEEDVRGIDNFNTLDRLVSSVNGYLQDRRSDYLWTDEDERKEKFGKNFLGLSLKQEDYAEIMAYTLTKLRSAASYDWTELYELRYVARAMKFKDIEKDINGIRKTFERKIAPECRKMQSLIDKKEMWNLGLYVEMCMDPNQEPKPEYIPEKSFRSFNSKKGKTVKDYIFDNGIFNHDIFSNGPEKKYFSSNIEIDDKFVHDQFNLESMSDCPELSDIALFVLDVNYLKSEIMTTKHLEDFYREWDVRYIDGKFNSVYNEANKLFMKYNKLTGDFGLKVSLLKDIEDSLRKGDVLYEPNPADKNREKKEKKKKKQRKMVANFIKKNSKKIQKVNELIGRDMNANGNVIFAIDNFDRATEEAKARMKDPKTNLEVFAKRREIEQRKAMRAKEEAMKTRAQRKEEQRKKPSSPNPNNKARKPKEEERSR